MRDLNGSRLNKYKKKTKANERMKLELQQDILRITNSRLSTTEESLLNKSLPLRHQQANSRSSNDDEIWFSHFDGIISLDQKIPEYFIILILQHLVYADSIY